MACLQCIFLERVADVWGNCVFSHMGVILLKNERGLTLHLIFLSCHIRDSLSGCETWIQIIRKLHKARCAPFPGWRGASHWSASFEGYKGEKQDGESALGYSAPWGFSACSGYTEETLSLYLDLPLWGGGRWQLWGYSDLKRTPDTCDPGSWRELALQGCVVLNLTPGEES